MSVRRAIGFMTSSYSTLLEIAASTTLDRKSSPAQSGFCFSWVEDTEEEEEEARHVMDTEVEAPLPRRTVVIIAVGGIPPTWPT